MRRIILPLFLFALLTLPTQAQNGYRLRVPTAEEYLTALPTIIEQAYSDNGFGWYISQIARVELNRYSDLEIFSRSFAALWRTAQLLELSHSNQAQDLERWILELTRSAYRDGLFELSDGLDITPESYFHIRATAVDFNQNTLDDYILQIENTWGVNLFIVAIAQENRQFDFRPTVLPAWQGLGPSGLETLLEQQSLRDVNGDNLPEWQVMFTYQGGWHSDGKLYVLSWRNGELVDVATDDLFRYWMYASGGGYPTPEWTHTGDHIEMHYAEIDDWGCITQITHTLYWDATAFYTDRQRDEAESAACAMRDAESFYANQDYAQALLYYQTALDRAEAFGQALQYIRARMALAHAFLGEFETARTVIAGEPHSGLMGGLLDQLQTALTNQNPLETMCRTAYDFILEVNQTDPATLDYYPPYYSYHPDSLDYPPGWTFGEPDDPRGVTLPRPEKAGCDIAAMSGERPSSEPTMVFEPPPPTPIVIPQILPNDLIQLTGGTSELNVFLGKVETRLQYQNSLSATEIHETRYYRALALQALNRPDEALAEYVTIYETAPESAWGMLAALHIEKVNS